MQIDESEADGIDTSNSEAALNPQDAAAIAEMSASRKERQAAQALAELPSQRDGQEPSGMVVKRRGRAMGAEARAKLAEAVADLKKQVTEQGANVDEFDDYDLGSAESAPRLAGDERTAAAPKPDAAAAAPARPATAAAAAVEPALAPPAPSLDPQVLDKRRQLDDRERELVARERALTDREAGSDIQRLYDAYGEQPVASVMDLIKRSLGVEKDEDVRTEVADLVSALSNEVLGVDLPADVRALMESKRTKRIVKNHERRLTQREQEIERKRLESEHTQLRAQAIGALTRAVHADDGRKQYQWLSRESNPGEIIADVIEAQQRKDGDSGAPLAWAEAAKRADAYLQRQASAYYDARKDLFQTGQPAIPAPTTATEAKPAGAKQGDPAGIRGSRSLTNEAASQPSAAPPPEGRSAPVVQDSDPNRRRGWSNDRWRANTRRNLRAAFRSAETQEE